MSAESGGIEKYEVDDNFNVICALLGELWSNYREEEEWEQFSAENDVGLFLAYLLVEQLIKLEGLASAGKAHIHDTWEVLCYTLDADADAEYDDLEDLFERSRLNPLGR